jgi:hypothetical protein
MDESFRNAVCIRVVALSNSLSSKKVSIPDAPKTVPVFYEHKTIVPRMEVMYSKEMICMGVILGLMTSIFIQQIRF